MEVIVAAKFVSERNIKFLLYEVLDVESLTKHEYYKEHNRKMFDMVLKAAVKLGKDLLFPIFEEMDRRQPELLNGEVKVHPSVKTIMKEFGDAAVSITGDTPSKKRQESIDRFQTYPAVRLFVGSITACAEGITLTAASRVVFVEQDWRPSKNEQAIDRAHRIGQRDTVFAQFLVFEGSLDARMAKMNLGKKQIMLTAFMEVDPWLGAR